MVVGDFERTQSPMQDIKYQLFRQLKNVNNIFFADFCRFEMPYNIWCGGCNSHIGMGVRYNAEKKKVGNYYSTPIWQFRMKCHLCDNYFEINTDPQVWDFPFLKNLI